MAFFGGGSDQTLQITLRAKDEATQSINKVRLSIGDLAKGFVVGNLATDVFRRGLSLVSGVISASQREYQQQAQALAQMNAVLKSTGSAAGLTAKQLVDLSTSLSKATLFTDDQVLSAQNLLLTFTNIKSSIFEDTTRAVLDLSQAMGQDLKSSAVQLGKALNDPLTGISALQRVGVSFSSSQEELIAKLVKSGNTLEAQRLILKELNKEFGGSAESAYAAASSYEKMEKNIQELEQGIGSGLVPAVNNLFHSFEQVTAGMGDSVDVGRATFVTFSTITQTAAAAAVMIHSAAAAFVLFGSKVTQYSASVGGAGLAMKMMGKEVKENTKGFDDFNNAVLDGVSTSRQFYDQLVEQNGKVLKTWGDMTTSALTLGKTAPDAYQKTAKEAAEAAKKGKEAAQSIMTAKSAVEDFQRALRGDREDLAKSYADAEQRLFGLRKQASTEDDPERMKELQLEITKQQSALDRLRPNFQGDQSTVLDTARRYAEATDLERSFLDIAKRTVEQTRSFAQTVQLNFNFNDAVAGDQGIRDIIMKTMQELDRQSTLKGLGGL